MSDFKLFLLVGLLFLIPFSGFTQESADDNTAHPVNLQTPKATLTSFIFNLQEDSFNPKIAAKTLHPLTKEPNEEELIVELKQILDGAGILIDLDEVPDENNFIDSTKSKQHYYLAPMEFPAIYLEEYQGKWYFSKKTATQIPAIHAFVYPFGTDKLMNVLPKLGNRKFIGLHSWQLISILLLIIICVVIHKILTWLFDEIIFQILNRKGYKQVAHDFILPVARPFSLLVIVLLLIVFVPVLQLPITVNHYLVLLLNALLPFFATIMVYRMVDILGEYLLKLASKTESTMDDQIVPVLKRVLKIFVVVLGFLFILSKLRFDITALLAGISIGGLAIALAAQETIKNFFGSLMIFFDKPFQIGDWITADSIDGTVEEVGFRSTRIRTFRNSVITVPNGKLTDMAIDNHGLRLYRRFYTTITVTYDTPTHLLESFVAGLKKIVDSHPKTRKDNYHVYFNNMSAYSLDIMFYVFIEVPTWQEELKHKEEILFAIMKLAKSLGIQFAFPTQTLHMEKFPGKPSLSPTYEDQTKINSKMSAFFNKEKSDNS
jgi:MscS family membrane protein